MCDSQGNLRSYIDEEEEEEGRWWWWVEVTKGGVVVGSRGSTRVISTKMQK